MSNILRLDKVHFYRLQQKMEDKKCMGEGPPFSLDGAHLSLEQALQGGGMTAVWDDQFQVPTLVRSEFRPNGPLHLVRGTNGRWYPLPEEKAQQYYELLKGRPEEDRQKAATLLAEDLENRRLESLE